jgi:Na+-translocating ferredoxin:NAD+ oxidoreductase RnfD subunit
MATRPTAEEAARSLRDIDQRTDQALELMVARRWVYVVGGLAVFAYLASADFLGAGATSVVGVGFFVLGAAYWALMWTGRGSAVLGQPVRRHKQALSRKSRVYGTLAIVALVAASAVSGLTGASLPPRLPYWHTALGAVLAVTLIGFGPNMQRAMNSMYKRTPGSALGRADGGR